MPSDSAAVEAVVTITDSEDNEVRMSPADFHSYLDQASQINTVTTSIKVVRSIPRDKFEKNEYFFSNTTNVEGVYTTAANASGDQGMIRKILGGVILERVQKSFNLGRIALKQQQQSDGLTVVSLSDTTQVL